MTDPNKTSITVILDKSGSMNAVREDTVGGYNSFIDEQKKLPGDCEITLIQFNQDTSFTYKSKPIQELKEGLSLESFIPSGYTGLFDAVGKAIIEKGAEFAALKEEERPGKVMFVIITDGQENASREFTQDKIKEMIGHQKDTYSWDFTFLGANIDTMAASDAIGILASKSLSFSTTSKGGASRAFASVNMYASSVRCAGSKDASYSQVDRDNNK